MKERFVSKNFASKTLAVIEYANEIFDDLARYQLTLRQLYYQFVGRDLFPDDRWWFWVESTRRWIRDPTHDNAASTKNADPNYKWLGGIINDARLAGLVDWDRMEDRMRIVQRVNMWDSIHEVIEASANQYKEDPWLNQEYRPEVWIEKDALVGVIEGVCREHRVPWFACRGYTSQSAAYEAGKRFADHWRNGFIPIIFHLGDHDPSGIDMTRDNGDRLSMFAGDGVEVRRLALNWDQIEEYDPPPNPAKMTDSRFQKYVDRYGNESWELDALDPAVIEELVKDELDTVIDREQWDSDMEDEEENRDILISVSDRWNEVCDFVRNL